MSAFSGPSTGGYGDGSPRQLASAAYTTCFRLVKASDGITAATGKSPTVRTRKPGGSFAAIAGSVAEIANGWYEIAWAAADLDTPGSSLVRVTASGACELNFAMPVVALDPFAVGLDVRTDTTTDPLGYELVWYDAGHGGDSAHEVKREKLYKADGSRVTADTDVVARWDKV